MMIMRTIHVQGVPGFGPPNGVGRRAGIQQHPMWHGERLFAVAVKTAGLDEYPRVLAVRVIPFHTLFCWCCRRHE